MKTATACLAVAGVALAIAAPASAAPRSDPEPTAQASVFGIGFVTLPLIDRTLTLARRVHIPVASYRRLNADMRELKIWYRYWTLRKRARRYCQAIGAAFGHRPLRYFWNGSSIVAYPYDPCEEAFG
jgi:hypothetical protein